MAIIEAMVMALPLTPPKGFKFCRSFSRPNVSVASTSQVPQSNIFVPSTNLEDSEQPTTPIGENIPQKKSMKKIINSSSFGCLFSPWTKPIYKEKEVTKTICKLCYNICGKSILLVAKKGQFVETQGEEDIHPGVDSSYHVQTNMNVRRCVV